MTSLAEQNGWEQCAQNPDGTLKDAEHIDFGHDPGADNTPLGGKKPILIFSFKLIPIFSGPPAVQTNNTPNAEPGTKLNISNLTSSQLYFFISRTLLAKAW